MPFTVCMTRTSLRPVRYDARSPSRSWRSPWSASRRCGDDTVPVAADTGSAVDSGLEPGDEISADDLASLLEDALAQGKEAGSASVSFEAGSSEKTGLSGEGVVAYADETVEADFTVESGLLGGSAEVRMVDGVLYCQGPDVRRQVLQDRPGRPRKPARRDARWRARWGAGAHPDLESMFDGLEGAISEATYVGEDDVQGESLSHYSVEIDPAELVDGAEHLSQLAAGSTLAVDLWFDGEDYLRQVEFDAKQVGTVELSLSDWGADVAIEAPPADQVTQFSGMFAG